MLPVLALFSRFMEEFTIISVSVRLARLFLIGMSESKIPFLRYILCKEKATPAIFLAPNS